LILLEQGGQPSFLTPATEDVFEGTAVELCDLNNPSKLRPMFSFASGSPKVTGVNYLNPPWSPHPIAHQALSLRSPRRDQAG